MPTLLLLCLYLVKLFIYMILSTSPPIRPFVHSVRHRHTDKYLRGYDGHGILEINGHGARLSQHCLCLPVTTHLAICPQCANMGITDKYLRAHDWIYAYQLPRPVSNLSPFPCPRYLCLPMTTPSLYLVSLHLPFHPYSPSLARKTQRQRCCFCIECLHAIRPSWQACFTLSPDTIAHIGSKSLTYRPRTAGVGNICMGGAFVCPPPTRRSQR